jgi:hypothetical protein
VAKLLNKLLIEQTKSRPRHSNDNGWVEAKNGAVVRKHMGYTHIAALLSLCAKSPSLQSSVGRQVQRFRLLGNSGDG